MAYRHDTVRFVTIGAHRVPDFPHMAPATGWHHVNLGIREVRTLDDAEMRARIAQADAAMKAEGQAMPCRPWHGPEIISRGAIHITPERAEKRTTEHVNRGEATERQPRARLRPRTNLAQRRA